MDNKCVVFYEAWQLDCCGTPFSVGDKVKWLVEKADKLLTSIEIGTIDYCYEAHSSERKKIFVIEGKVKTINTLLEKYTPTIDKAGVLKPVNGKLVETMGVRRYEERIGGMTVSGYVVTICEYTVRPAKENEVTFR